MVCIYCQGSLAVSNSRPQKSRNQTWRRRYCKACGAVFTSIEIIDLSQAITVRKTTGTLSGNAAHSKPAESLQAFSRDKLFTSIYQSLKHRADAIGDARGLCDTVTAHIIRTCRSGRVDASTIAAAVLSTLQRFDDAAATHYAAFHKQR